MKTISWESIFNKYDLLNYDFEKLPFYINAKQIKEATSGFSRTSDREVRLLCKQDTRESRPQIFKDNGLFILPTKNGEFAIIKGEGYVDIPDINDSICIYNSKLEFKLDTVSVGDSEMQHLDYAYAVSLIRTFLEDPSLVLTIRGRKRTPSFSFCVGSQKIEVKSVQTEVDAGYEGKDKIVLIEAKNKSTKNTIIRQLFYPFRQWSSYSAKEIYTIFFSKSFSTYSFWQFQFDNANDYNSISLVKSCKYEIK